MRERLDAALFAPVDGLMLAGFRAVVAVFLAYAVWPRGLAPSAAIESWPPLEQLFHDVFFSMPYRAAVYGTIVWFALGWRSRTSGATLFCLLFPNAFLSKGRVSGQLLLTTVLLTSLLRAAPLWRASDPGRQSPGPMWPIHLLRCQLSLLYAVNAIRKSTAAYLSGEVLMGLSATRPNFLVDLTGGSMMIGPFQVPVAALATATVLIEYWLAVGWWIPRARWPTAILGVSFHLFLKAFVLRIFLLDATAILLYLAFLLPFGARDALSPRPSPAEHRSDALDEIRRPQA
jgi:hypothetical protein